MRALIVDDDQIALKLIVNILRDAGYEVTTARNGLEALETMRRGGVNLLVTDWEMPEMNGIELCRAIRTEDFAGYVYVIMLTAKDSTQQKIDGLFAGADNFIVKPVNPAELLVCLKTADRILSLETRDVAMFALAKLAESRDPETGSHIERVQSYSRLLAQHLSGIEKYRGVIDADYIRLLYQTSPLHDIGKVGIPDLVLLKPGKLSPQEFAIMKTHTKLGAQTLEAALQRFPGAKFLVMARDIAATHHEKVDGSGYPNGLVGEAIPLCGRIVALADVYDALTSRRVYKDAMPHEKAREIIVSETGKHFDPDVVAGFLQTEEHFLSIKNRLTDCEQEAPPLAVAAPAPEPANTRNAQRDRILVVEPDRQEAKHLIDVLRREGHEVVLAADGLEGRRLWLEYTPRIVIADGRLPGTSGIELCRRIRAADSTAYTQFIMISERSDKDGMIEAFDAGVDDFIPKPFDDRELVAKIRVGLRIVHLHDELSRKNHGSEQLNVQLSGLNQRLEKLAITDDLTGLFNRRHCMAQLEEQWALADRYRQQLTIALVDVDHFKAVNDTSGHATGDAILKDVSQILRESTRVTDTVCRVGGDEFLVIFPAQGLQESATCAEWIRAATEKHRFNVAGEPVGVTVSIGVADKQSGMAEFSELMEAVDQALYSAKQDGRNTVRLAVVNLSKPANAFKLTLDTGRHRAQAG